MPARYTGWLGRGSCILVAAALAWIAAGCRSASEREAFRAIDELERSTYATPRSTEGLRPALPELDNAAGLSEYLAYAALNSPALESAFYRWKAAVEKIPQARTLPDPRFTYGYYIRSVETRVGPQKHRFGLSQTFPWLAKLSLRSDVAARAAEAERQRYEAARLKLFNDVKSAWAEYYYLGRSVRVTEDNIKLVKYLESVVRIRYATATGSHPDLIRAQVELGKLADRLRSLKDMRGPAAAKLNAALGRRRSASIPWPRTLPAEAVAVEETEVLARLRHENPQLNALAEEVQKQEAAVKLAAQNYFPDVTLGVEYILTDKALMSGVRGSGKDPIVAVVSVNLPIWWGSYRAAQREARSMRRAAKNALVDRENVLTADARMALFQLRDAERRIRLYRDTLIPKATESLKATETAYKGGTETFYDLLEAQRVLLEFQLILERGLADRLKSIARIEMLIGQPLPSPAAPSGDAGGETKATPIE